ncbi:MAG: TonB-dependent receptor [Bacteroidales bacterium]|nr:TonB-dependent receptor [Bacteroidales bacterium]
MSNLPEKVLIALLTVFLLAFSMNAQERVTASGTVLDENGLPLIGAAVVEGTSSNGTTTDIDGHFSLTVSKGSKLNIIYIGYVAQEIDPGVNLKITLVPDSDMLAETVIIGYGVQRKTDLTGSISSVSSKDFNEGAISSPAQLINGKVSGVQITSGGGSPTAGNTIRIRGGASLNASNDPLIVLDGVPMEVGGSISGGGDFLSLINPNDIESITVLKDAASTSIYGSRASNGVIIITTKKGTTVSTAEMKKGPNVSFSTTNSYQTPTRMADMLNRSEFVDVINTYGTDAQKALVNSSVSTDWNDLIFQNAFSTDNNLGLAGNFAGVLPFRISAGFSNQNGILKTDRATRTTGSITLSPTLLDGHLRLVLNGKGTYNSNRFANQNAIWGGATHNPTLPVYSGTGEFLGYTEAADANGIPVNGATGNPLALIENYKSTSKVYRLIGSFDADYSVHFLPELHIHTTLGYDYSKGEGEVFVPAEAFQYYNTGGRDYTYGPQQNYNRLATIYANYSKYFEPIKSSIDLTAGYDYQFWKYTTAKYTEYNVAQEVQTTSAANDQRHVLLSWYGRLNWTMMSRYLLSVSVRTDGSSRFSEDNRWGVFPSVALAWKLSEENFFQPLKSVMNTAKIRLSYGVTGQQDGIANYSYMPLYTASQAGADYMFGGNAVTTYRPSAYNSDLKWETTKALNAGFDFGFIDDRITGSVDWYDRKTEDLLATVPVAAGTNFNKELLTNVGNIKSTGVEMSLSATVIDTKELTWDVSANATWMKSEITNLRLNSTSDAPNTPAGWIDSHYVQVLSEGYAPYSFYVYKQVYDEATGKPIEGLYADLNEDGEINSDDLYHAHKPAPDWMLGFSTSLTWKKLTLSTTLRANIGNYLFNGMAMNTGAWETVSYNDYQLNNVSSSFLETTFRKRQYESDYYLENASFLKMDNLQLSYNFGKIRNLFNLNVSAMVQNVFTITEYSGVDPECAGGIDISVYPRPRIFSLTVGLDF